MPRRIQQLWPDFQAEPRPRTIRRLLLEAGAGLGEQTGNRIQFVVDSTPGLKGKGFAHDCYLFAPALSYRYPLCKVGEAGEPYPVVLIGDGTFQKGIEAKDEATLMENLRLLFHADATKRAVLQLLDILS